MISFKEPHAGCPEKLRKKFGQSPAGLDPPAGARIRKKENIPPKFKKK